jgi:hypothetical protein
MFLTKAQLIWSLNLTRNTCNATHCTVERFISHFLRSSFYKKAPIDILLMCLLIHLLHLIVLLACCLTMSCSQSTYCCLSMFITKFVFSFKVIAHRYGLTFKLAINKVFFIFKKYSVLKKLEEKRVLFRVTTKKK